MHICIGITIILILWNIGQIYSRCPQRSFTHILVLHHGSLNLHTFCSLGRMWGYYTPMTPLNKGAHFT